MTIRIILLVLSVALIFYSYTSIKKCIKESEKYSRKGKKQARNKVFSKLTGTATLMVMFVIFDNLVENQYNVFRIYLIAVIVIIYLILLLITRKKMK